jgi:transposase
MATLDAQVEANLGPFRTAVELIMSIPGIKNLGAHVIVSEIGSGRIEARIGLRMMPTVGIEIERAPL